MRALEETRLDDREMILRCLRGIEDAKPVGAHRRDMWERCWSGSTGAPPYYGSDIMRREGRFYAAPGAELAYLEALREELFAKYLGPVREVHEFGCGGGQNLRAIAGRKKTIGYDWSPAAVQRAGAFGSGVLFDMASPAPAPVAGEAVLTVHALEQLGTTWGPLLDMLLAARPAVCIHIEPIEELYDPGDLLDWLALAYHRKRGYLSGFLTRLRLLAERGDLEILEERRNLVGNLYHEAYSVIVWRAL